MAEVFRVGMNGREKVNREETGCLFSVKALHERGSIKEKELFPHAMHR